MNKDIRIDISFSNHRKRKKLFNLLGAQGVISLIDLWLATAQNRPRGVLTGMDESDIALDGQWSADAGQFCKVLCEVGFLDRAEDGTYSIHDWKDHQPFCFYSEERSRQARQAAEIRWGKENPGLNPKVAEQDADSMQGACDQHAERNAPSPIPSPIPKDIKAKCPHDEIVKLYHEVLPSLPRIKIWTEDRKKHLRARWAEDPKRQDLEWWKKYFEHVAKSSFLTGTNDRGWTANLEWLVRQGNFVNVMEGKYHKGTE